MKSRYLHSWLVPQLMICICLALGCTRSSDAYRVDSNRARETLGQVLASWQAGYRPEDWKSRTPQVVIQDMDWKSGAKLLDYQILDDGEALDANLHCQVKIKLQMPGKSTTERTVTYLVSTKPVLTVFRALGP